MHRITRQQFEQGKRLHVVRHAVEVDGFYGLRVLPPETPYGLHLPFFVTGIVPESEYGYQILGRLLTRRLKPRPVQITPEASGFFDSVWLMNIFERSGKSWDLLADPGYLTGTNRLAEGLDTTAMARLTLGEKTSQPVAELDTYNPGLL